MKTKTTPEQLLPKRRRKWVVPVLVGGLLLAPSCSDQQEITRSGPAWNPNAAPIPPLMGGNSQPGHQTIRGDAERLTNTAFDLSKYVTTYFDQSLWEVQTYNEAFGILRGIDDIAADEDVSQMQVFKYSTVIGDDMIDLRVITGGREGDSFEDPKRVEVWRNDGSTIDVLSLSSETTVYADQSDLTGLWLGSSEPYLMTTPMPMGEEPERSDWVARPADWPDISQWQTQVADFLNPISQELDRMTS